MEIKKTYEYSAFKNVSLNISFADETEYTNLLRDFNRVYTTTNSDELITFINQLTFQLEAPCS